MRAYAHLEPLADPDAVVAGDHYRITVLTEGLLRLEYAEDGRFEDRPSAFALHRRHAVPDFAVTVEDGWLVLDTARVRLTYDRSPFTANGLSAQVKGNVSAYHSVWRFGAELGTLGGTARTLDEVDGSLPLDPGVVSRRGFSVIDDSASPVLDGDWFAPRTPEPGRHDLYLFAYGLDHAEAVRALHAVSGHQPVLPRWALGNWWSRYHAYSDAAYRALVERFEAEDLPFSVAVLDMDWHRVADVDPRYGSGWTGYSWNRELFPDPPAFLAWLHERGLRVTLNVHPADGVRAYEDAYPAMCAALDRDPSTGDAIAFDVTDRRFMDAYFDVLHRGLEADGVDFWWLDWQQGPYSRLAGIDPLWVLNHLHFLDSRHDGRRPLTFSRYAGPGSHRYPVGFSGDSVVSWASLEFQPEFTASASNIGYGWWSHDIGGHFRGVRDDELMARWVQLGVFSPILRLHSSDNEFLGKEPWRYRADVRAVIGDQLRLRHRLVPYLHAMNHRAAREGEPLVRPMYWTHPHEEEAYAVPNQFRFGTELVVAPVATPADPVTTQGSVTVWLPPGRWVDLFTEVVYDGARTVVMSRPITSIPVLAKAGAIVPMAPDGERAETVAPEVLDLVVVVGADGALDLVEDDGTGDGLDEAHVATTPLRWDQGSGTLRIGPATGAAALLPARRRWRVGFPASTLEPVEVEGAVDESVVVEVGPGAVTATSDLRGRLFDLVDRAQTTVADKTAAWAVVGADTSRAARLASLAALGLHRPVELMLVELLGSDEGLG